MTTPTYPATFSAGTAATQIWGMLGDGAQVTVINEDLTRPVYVGYRTGITAGTPDALTIPPLGAAVMDASRAAWIVAAESGIVVQTAPGAAQWTPSPAQVSEQISALGLARDTSVHATTSAVGTVTSTLGAPAQDATVGGVTTAVGAVHTALGSPAQDTTVAATTTAVNSVHTVLGTPAQKSDVQGVSTSVNTVNNTLGTPAQTTDVTTALPSNLATGGVPPILKSTPTINTGTQVIAAGATFTSPLKTLSALGYEIFIEVKCATGSTAPFVQVNMTWQDSATGQVVSADRWYLAGANAAFQSYMGTGPTKGNQLALTVVNGDTVNATSINIVLLQNSRTYVRDDWRNQSTGAVPTFTQATYDVSSNYLFSSGPTVAANSATNRIMPLYSGIVSFSFENFTGAGAAFFSVAEAPPVSFTGLAASNVFSSGMVSGTNASVNGSLSLPRSVCVAQIVNNAASPQTLGLSLIASEQAI